ncbi:MAG: DUF3737 family protein [Clostridia bacterium]|nr:DUF3737 family protein [Clostridia bacterium]
MKDLHYTKTIENLTDDKERALYGVKDAIVSNCHFVGPADGESCLKETSNLLIKDCHFKLRYPLWHNVNSKVVDCTLYDTCRAPIWYCENVVYKNVICDSIKAVRECNNIVIEDCTINSAEFGWLCKNVKVVNTKLVSEYPFLHLTSSSFNRLQMKAKYSFQYCRDLVLEDCVLDTKDAFWHGENVVIKNCVVKGEYLAWYSKNLTFIDCEIRGTQPFCYAENLKLVNCKLYDCDLAFENTTVEADITTSVDSVKNPIGKIKAKSIGEVIVDEFARGTCEIVTEE